MGDKIWIDGKRVEEDATRIEGAAAYLRQAPLNPQDMRTTIPANAGSKAAYVDSQERIYQLGILLDQEVKNIRGLGAAFIEFDEMLGRLMDKMH